MKGIFVVLAVIACASALTTVDKEWEAFKTQFAKSYSGEEDVRRHGIFAANKKMIEEHNKKYEAKEVTFFMAVNKFADMTEDEISLLKGFKRSPEEIKNKVNLYKPKVGVSNPDTLDWRNYGYVTGVKDQGQCGSCWSFSSTGALEGQHFRYHGALISLSEQNLVDCVTTNAGCNGGWMDDAFTYVGQTGGIDTEANYPYEAADDVCRYHGGTSGVTLWGYVDLPYGDETSLWDATANVGPIAVAIDASWASFNYYGGGVYYEPSCTVNYLDHAVLVAGYGNDNGADYWLVKNSWGSSWGEAGYIRMSRNANNQCGIASAASYPLVN